MQKLLIQKTPLQNVNVVFDNTVRILKIRSSSTTRVELHKLLQESSMASLGEAFKALNVDVLAARVNAKQLEEVPFPAIAHLTSRGGHFVLLTDLTNGQLTYHDPASGWVTENITAFSTLWSGAILLLEKKTTSGDLNYDSNRRAEMLKSWRNGTSISLLAAWILYSLGTGTRWNSNLAGSLLVIGAALSGLLIAADLGNSVAQRLCKTNEAFNCRSVLNSPAAMLFGWLKMSEVGWVWFFGGWLAWWLGSLRQDLPAVLGALSLGSLLAAAYAPFSIGYQWLKIKHWCALCLAVQVVLVGIAFSLSPYLSLLPAFIHSTSAQYSIISGYGLSLLLWISSRPLLYKVQQSTVAVEEVRRFKSDSRIFNFLLMQQPLINHPVWLRDIGIGKPTAPYKLTLITNPYCEPCIRAHRVLEELLGQMKGRLYVNIIFLTDSSRAIDSGYQVALHLLSLAPQHQPAALQDWFDIRDYAVWADRFPVHILPSAEEALLQQLEWNRSASITQTPSIVLCGRKLPEYYNLQDLAYHLPRLGLAVT